MHVGLVAVKLRHLFERRYIPEANRIVGIAGCEPGTVRSKREGVDDTRLCESRNLPEGTRVQETDSTVVGRKRVDASGSGRPSLLSRRTSLSFGTSAPVPRITMDSASHYPRPINKFRSSNPFLPCFPNRLLSIRNGDGWWSLILFQEFASTTPGWSHP